MLPSILLQTAPVEAAGRCPFTVPALAGVAEPAGTRRPEWEGLESVRLWPDVLSVPERFPRHLSPAGA